MMKISSTGRNIIRRMRHILFLSLGYLIIFLIINPLEYPNFIVGDEWSSFRQIEAFEQGVYRLNAQKDTAFILQGVLAFLANILIGNVFLTVRLLNFIITLALGIGLYLLLDLLIKNPKAALLLSVIIFINPLFLFLSFTFYSEIYFLALLIWASYFLGIYYNFAPGSGNITHLVLGALLGGMSILVRQQGIILPASFCLVSLVKAKKVKSDFIVISAAALFFVLIYSLWPVYISWDKEYLLSGLVKLFGVTSSRRNWARYLVYLFMFPYFGLFLFPVLKKPRFNIFIAASSLFIAYVIFKFDVFPIGNVLSLGGIYSKTYGSFAGTLFDTFVFKILISILSGFGCVFFVLSAYRYLRSKHKYDFLTISLVLMIALYLLSNLAVSDVYDRYLLIPFVFVVLSLAKEFKSSINFSEISVLVLLFVFSFTLSFEYFLNKKISYALASSLIAENSKLSRVRVDDEFGKYHKSVESNDFTGLIYVHPEEETKCVVHKIYSLEKESNITKLISAKSGKFVDWPLESGYTRSYGYVSFYEPSRIMLGYVSTISLMCK